MNIVVNASAVFRSKGNESKCSEEVDCYISSIAGAGRIFPDISATITQNCFLEILSVTSVMSSALLLMGG